MCTAAHLVVESADVQQEQDGNDSDAGAVKVVPGAVEVVLLVCHHLLGLISSLHTVTNTQLSRLLHTPVFDSSSYLHPVVDIVAMPAGCAWDLNLQLVAYPRPGTRNIHLNSIGE